MREEFLDPGIEDDSTDPAEVGLRPQTLSEFVGQSELKEHLQIVLEAAKKRAKLLITCYSQVLQGSARQLSPASSLSSVALTCM